MIQDSNECGQAWLELHVRSLSPDGARSRQDAVIDRLQRFDERDVIRGYDVHVWGDALRPTSLAAQTDVGEFALERLSAIEDWADRNGVSVEGVFPVREVDSAITGERYVEISFPMVLLTEFAGDDLRRVAPCVDDGRTFSVDDCLDVIERERTIEADTPAASTPPTDEAVSRARTSVSPERGRERRAGGETELLTAPERFEE